jgi:hypothetical protein
VLLCPQPIPASNASFCTFVGGVLAPVAADGSYSTPVGSGTWYAAALSGATQSAAVGPFTVNDGDALTQDLSLAFATVSGTVRNAGGLPLAGLTVQFCPGTTPACASPVQTTTGPSGTYSLAVAPGSWNGRVQAAGGAFDVRTVAVADGDTPTVDFQIGGGRIEGATLDATGNPYAYNTVLQLCRAGSCTPVSIAGPSYAVDGVAAGTYSIYAANLGGGIWATQPVAPVDVTEGATTSGVDLRLGAGGIDATVTDGTNPIAGASLQPCLQGVAGPPNGEACTGSTSTDGSGHALLPGLPDGTYSVRVSRSGYGSTTITGVVITSGSTPHIDVVLGAPASVTGTVSGDLGTMAAVAACAAPTVPDPAWSGPSTHPCGGPTSGTFALVNTATGAYTLSGLSPGTYNFRAYAVTGGIVAGPVTSATLVTGSNVVDLSMSAAPPPDDGDGVDEDPVVDGNGDGTPDAQQPNVTTLPAGTGGGAVTIAAPDATYALGAVSASAVPGSPALPPGAVLPIGLVNFEVHLPNGVTTADVDVYTPAGTNPSSWFKLQHGAWSNFTSNATFSGDKVTLHLVDGGAGDADGAVNGVIVDPSGPGVNHAPTATTDSATVVEDGSVVIDVAGNDSPNDAGQMVSVTSVGAAAHGMATRVTSGADTGKVRYVPVANYSGPDSFTYDVCDDGLPVACATGTVNVDVTPVNDAPRARIDLATTEEDTPLVIDVLANDDAGPGEGGQALSVTQLSDALLGNVSVIASGPDAGKVRFMPSSDKFGIGGFLYKACDDGVPVKCDASLVVTGVAPVNDAPTISATSDKTVKKNKSLSFTIDVGDVDNAASSLTVTKASTNTTVIPTANVEISGFGSTRTVKITPASNKTGTSTITLTVRDPSGATSSDQFTVNVTS